MTQWDSLGGAEEGHARSGKGQALRVSVTVTGGGAIKERQSMGAHHLSLKIHKDGMEEAGCCGEGGGVG